MGRPNFTFGQLHAIMDFYDYFFSDTYAFFWIVDPSLLGLLVEEHDSVQQPI